MSFLKPYLTALVLPPASLILMLLLGLWLGRRRKGLGRTLVFSAISLLWLLSTSGAASWIQTYLLRPPPALGLLDLAKLKTELKGQPAMIVVLGGGRRAYAPEYGAAGLKPRTAERLRYGIWLSRETGLPLAFSGGVGHGALPGATEGEVAARVAREEYGRPLKWVEDRSRDTRENARMAVAMLKEAKRQLDEIMQTRNMLATYILEDDIIGNIFADALAERALGSRFACSWTGSATC